MIPVAYQPSKKFRPEFRTCFHCGIRLSARTNTSKKSCLDCEDRMHAAIWRVRAKILAAIRRGELQRATELTCIDCGEPAVCYDHRDYSKPLEVSPVCKSCNNKRGPGKLP